MEPNTTNQISRYANCEQTSQQYAVNQNRPLTTPDNGSVATGVILQTCSRHALQRLKLLVRVGSSLGRGLQHVAAPRAPVARWLQASTTSSTTMVAGLQQAAAPRASVAIGERYCDCRLAPLRLQVCSRQRRLELPCGGYRLALLWLQACSTRCSASSAWPAARGAAPRAPAAK
eukprot:scaffold51074_cov69-Phaeocystis_antarctica.AAC.2